MRLKNPTSDNAVMKLTCSVNLDQNKDEIKRIIKKSMVVKEGNETGDLLIIQRETFIFILNFSKHSSLNYYCLIKSSQIG